MMTCTPTLPALARRAAAALLALTVPAGAESLRPIVAISPGASAGSAGLVHRCPTFTWSGADPGAAIELALWRVAAERVEAIPAGDGGAFEGLGPPRWRIRLPAGASAWSAAGGYCLDEPGTYLWRVRSAFGAERSAWSEPLWLAAEAAPTAEELTRALELLERWEAAQGKSRARSSGSEAASGADGESARARRAIAPRDQATLGTSPPLGTPAVDAELPDTALEVYGVLGTTHSTVGRSAGVYGYASPLTGPGAGVFGHAESSAGVGVSGLGAIGVGGSSLDEGGSGVYGESLGSGQTFGTYGQVESAAGAGAAGENASPTGDAIGVYGNSLSTAGRGVWGEVVTVTGATQGVRGYVTSTSGTGVYGLADAGSGFTYGVYGYSLSPAGTGVYGAAGAVSGTPYGVVGYAGSPTGVGASGWGASATGANAGVYGVTDSTAGTGVVGYASKTTGSTVGVEGRSESSTGKGVLARATSTSGINYGLYADTSSPDGYAGYFLDRVYIGSHLNVTGTLSKGGGSFKIDHPLDPENRYLLHSFVESPDMMNLYNGVVVIGADGFAWVELPAWFEALNRDFRYHLTPLGRFAPLYVEQEIVDGRFRIGGGLAGQRVSWLVTGIRQDPFANRHRIPVEVEKAPEDRGSYLHPEAFGLGQEWGLRSLAPITPADEERELPPDPPRP